MRTAKLTSASRVVRREELVTAEIDDDLVMMSLRNSNYYSLDCVGKAIWKHLGEPVLVSALVDRLVSEFEVDQPRCLKDVLSLLDDLEREGLILRVV